MKSFFDVTKNVATLALIWIFALVGIGFCARVAWYFVELGWGLLP